MKNKIQHGQFYTVGNPFTHHAFQGWINDIIETNDYDINTVPVIEPFAGANNIIRLLNEAGLSFKNWGCYDIDPPAEEYNTVPEHHVITQDVIKDYPRDYEIAITNPPYLAKNSAKRKGYSIDFKGLQDLYQVSIDVMLENNKYVAAIIPESFITAKSSAKLKQRCSVFISLTSEMFDDTDHPVCLALFNDKENNDITIYRGNNRIGELHEIKKKTEEVLTGAIEKAKEKFIIKFNDPQGEVGFRGIDNTKTDTIEFISGNTIKPETVKHTSRSLTRISIIDKNANNSAGLFDEYQNDTLIDYPQLFKDANELIKQYRQASDDVLMTSFKGLRSDGKYRRRMEFSTARKILEISLAQQL